MSMYEPCACCGETFHIATLDAKPDHLAGPGSWLERLFPRIRLNRIVDAANRGFDFERLECHRCYGPGWEPGVGELA